MKDTIFLQFYSKFFPDYKHIWMIHNGFSDTQDLCKSKGDFLWSELNVNDYQKTKLPFKKGKVYISAHITHQVYQSYVWAKNYPDIEFVVGGPAITTGTFTYNTIPKNLTFTNKSVEQYFGVTDFSYEWKIKLPKQVLRDDSDILFSYPISSNCYWRKCIFCSPDSSDRNRIRKKFNFEFKDGVNTTKTKSVFLSTPSVTPKILKTIIPNLPNRDDLRYTLFMRSSEKENEVLEEILKRCSNGEGPDPSKIMFKVGAEFAGNRMQKYIQKGSTIENFLNTIKIINKYNSNLNMFFMLGWPNLIKEDVYEVEQFVKKIPTINEKSLIFFKIWKLFVRVGSQLYGTVEKEEDVHIGPFHTGYTIKLSKEQIILNNEVRDLLLTYKHTVDNYTTELGQ